MLNISESSIKSRVDVTSFKTLNLVESKKSGKILIRILLSTLIIFLIIAFLPWTQNIRTKGKVTTLIPDNRPQTVNTIIAGRLEKWYVKEGDYVKKGDTLVYISEVKPEYMDPDLVGRTKEQLSAQESQVESFVQKVIALEQQIEALQINLKLKTQQAQNKLKQAELKLQSDSLKFEAAQINFEIAQTQLLRMQNLYEQGLNPLTDLEKRRMTERKTKAELIAAQNDVLTSQNKVLNAKIELNTIKTEYEKDIAKANSEKYTAISKKFESDGKVTKLKNQFSNYLIRSGYYFILAPQNGYVTQSILNGIGETLKEGEPILTIMPKDHNLAVEMFVKPVDLPLLAKKEAVRIIFDGWPAIVFSGWPNVSHGTYTGKIFAIDNFANSNGMYRVLVEADTSEYPWPKPLRVGAGTKNLVLLKDVPVWYEIWRKINGFPPDYYDKTNKSPEIKKKK